MAVCIHIITSIHCSRISAITVKFKSWPSYGYEWTNNSDRYVKINS